MNKAVRPSPEDLFLDWKEREVLAEAAIVSGINVVLNCWYDNEFGYNCQVVRCFEKFAGVDWQRYPTEV